MKRRTWLLVLTGALTIVTSVSRVTADTTRHRIDVPARAVAPWTVTLDGPTPVTLDLAPQAVRTTGYVLYTVGADGRPTPAPPGPVTTYRGTLRGEPGTRVAAAIVPSGLVARIERPGRETLWLEPSPEEGSGWHRLGPRATPGIVGSCLAPPPPLDETRAFVATAMATGGPTVAEIACDADHEYFLAWGSDVAAVEARITAIINQVNLQYESEVGITHEISAIVVRTAPTYLSTDPQTLLNEFRQRWLAQHGTVPRDLAHLFTGKELDGPTIGAALTEGAICTTQAYCLAESDYNGIFACATDLTAHELGHLWGASHCACPTFTMNPSITCANSFSAASRIAIAAHRDTRTCLDSDPVELYCTASSTSDDFEYISRVTVGDIDHPSGPSFYSNFTSISTEVTRDTIVPITIQIGGGFGSDIGALWIDWNGDDDFDDAEETVTTGWSGAGPYSTTIVVPADAPLGATRLRVRIQDGISDPTLLSCGFSDFGEVEDYTVIVGETIVTGACCLPDATCILVTTDDCVLAAGTYQGDDAACGEVTCAVPCPTDFDGDGTVGFLDLLPVLSNWGTCPACPEDLDDDGVVGFLDLLEVLSSWGPCP